MAIKTNVTIDNTLLPNCTENGISITPHKLYASNAGRSATTGDFIGDIIAIKYDAELHWDIMHESDMNFLISVADTTTVEHTVNMQWNGQAYSNKTCYVADLTRTIIRQRGNNVVYGDVNLHLVEV